MECWDWVRRELDASQFQNRQRTEWRRRTVSTRHKLGLSQMEFARLLGISVRTLHHWEQGTRSPSGAASVLIRIAAEHPEIVLKAA
jgi:DNA-binding transcriptional regulator YiaG